MTSELELLVGVGHDIISIKYYALATCTILFYDYLLTAVDEIKYVWSGRKSWTFYLFVFNRYFPMLYQLWQIGVAFILPSPLAVKICERSAWLSLLVFFVCTFLAQTVLTVRIYAVTFKNVPIALGFAAITVSQLALGMCTTVLAARRGAQPFPPIPLDAYHLCVFYRHRNLEVACISISLLYDSLAFLFIVSAAARSKVRAVNFPTILGKIAEDATWYFLVIFTSHFVLAMTLTLGRVRINPTAPIYVGLRYPALNAALLTALPFTTISGIVVYLPVMVSRMMLSMRKAADSPQGDWSLADLASANGVSLRSIEFSPRRGTDLRENSVLLDAHPGTQMETR